MNHYVIHIVNLLFYILLIQVRSRSQKCGQNRPELICVDFWESYDPDEVCSTGFGLIGTGSFTVARLCFLCGSAGKEKVNNIEDVLFNYFFKEYTSAKEKSGASRMLNSKCKEKSKFSPKFLLRFLWVSINI